jgi:CHAT domain-containing protein
VLHIATHGNFLKLVRPERSIYGITGSRYIENPLLRSMLLFSGAENTMANKRLQVDNDGLLTAYEAMNLHLEHTSLVVMSACETGLGEIRNGEGVYGLQRAFLLAGAKSVIMSLWNVNDESTRLLMTDFYRNWLNGTEMHSAFRKAVLDVRKKYPEFYYWGPFVLLGE